MRGRRRMIGVWTGAAAGLVAGAAAVCLAGTAPALPGRVEFNRDIRPILSDKCFKCHGPDEKARKTGLRLDLPDGARGVVVAGRPDRSRLIARVFAADPARRMPPPGSELTLSSREKLLLRRWVEQGGAFQQHWAFVRLPARVPAPAVKLTGWPRSLLDRFVLARLESEGLRPSPEATRADWLRRVTLDLTGLPPAPDDVDTFLRECEAEQKGSGLRGQGSGKAPRGLANPQSAIPNPQSYERVVDRLLASPRYGERMAVPWLDVARYADSYGYQSDLLSPTWPYRDWVIKAFNDNLPYDQFLTWQIAGDLLPNATRDQRLATAFNRLHRMTNEGGSVPEEWRLEGVADRVHTFGTAFVGLTFECARCHDHKYDPVAQRDYYALSAFFNSIDEYGLYDRADIVPSPSLLLPTPEQERALADAREGVGRAEQALVRAREEREGAFRIWRQQSGSSPIADMTGSFSFEAFEGTLFRNQAPGATAHGARSDEVPLIEGRAGKAALLDGENNVNFPELGRFTRHTPYTVAFWMRDSLRPGESRGEPAVIFQACSGTDTGPHGYDLILEEGRLSARMFRHWPGNAIGIRTRVTVRRDTWTHVAVTYDGSSRAAGLRVYLDGRSAEVEVLRDHLVKGTGRHILTFGQRFRDKGFKGGVLDELRLFSRALTALEISRLRDGAMAMDPNPSCDESALREFYFSAVDPEARRRADELAAARERLVAAEDAPVEVAVMEEMSQPRPAYVLDRGQYDARTTDANRVSRDTPRAILPFSDRDQGSSRRDRLGLARWLTRPDHPLTARVAVNRVWALLFGRGLVETSENFGLQGRPPSHPELLDWLARDFIASGWDVKGLIKKIVLSSTYRQASALRPDLRKRDPQNVLLARGPSHRLSAEAVRDTALAASGLLDTRIGGPPVSPYQPGDLWRESNVMSPAYRQSVGTDLYRRSLYTVWKRTAPMPNMLAFDAVTREFCVARRQNTSTPLQALVLLNDPQFVEAARVLGERTLREGGADPAGRVSYAFRRLAGRDPDASELSLLSALYAEQRARFAREPEQAALLVRIGERKPDPALAAPEVAAATVLAQTILNLDATIWKR